MTNERAAVAGGDCGDVECDACHFTRVQGVAHSAKKCINAGEVVGSGDVRAPAHVHSGHVDTGDVVYVPMTTADALGVGHSMRTLVRGRKLPPGTADIYDRVGRSMISEARLAIAKQQRSRS